MSTTSDTSAYVIVVGDDNTMTTTQKRRIVQRSKLVDDLWFLVKPEYNGYNMADFTVLLEYLAPVSKRYRTDILTLNADTYNGYLKYTLPINTSITAEAGEVELMLTFLLVELDENGKGVQRARKITGTKISITPISAWSDIIPDCALSVLDQRIIKMDAQLKALDEATNTMADKKADNLRYDEENRELQLLSGDKPIGDKVVLENIGYDEDGIPAVDFGISSDDTEPDDDNSSDVVEF